VVVAIVAGVDAAVFAAVDRDAEAREQIYPAASLCAACERGIAVDLSVFPAGAVDDQRAAGPDLDAGG
jgi:hypothetical protein